MKRPRLFVDLNLDRADNITGTIRFSADSPFVFEALQMVIREFSKACEVPVAEIVTDLGKRIKEGS